MNNCDNLPPDFPGYPGVPGYPNPYPSGSSGGGTGGTGGGTGGETGGGVPPEYLGAPGVDGLPSKSYIEIEQLKSQAAQTTFQQEYARISQQDAQTLLATKQTFFDKKQKFNACTPLTRKTSARTRKWCRCPVCHPLNRVKDKVAGKNYFKIPFTNFKIPRFDILLDLGKSFDSNRRKGEVCGACKGRKLIMDVADDSEAYAAAAQQLASKADEIMETEAKLGLGGTRTTIIQGSDLLFVGLGFNNNQTHEVIPDGAIAPSIRGGKIPQQNAVPINAVVGKQGGLGWPQQVGNYTIKCANKFSLLAGAGGITIATPGPLTISAGMTKIIGPQMAIGSSVGPLTLEGDSVNITSKSVSITPTGGELFVKGNISNTGNITTQGHAHFESVSFAKGMCVGTTKSTSMANANPDVTVTQAATWYPKSLIAALLDLQNYYQNVLADTKTSAFRLLSPKENMNIADRLTSIAKLSVPLETQPTGFLIPGTPITIAGSCPCNLGGLAGGVIMGTITSPVPLFNMPHNHGIPESLHSHEITMPDIDYSGGSPNAVRSKVLNGAHESGVPSDPTKDTTTRLSEALRTTIEFSFNLATEAIKTVAKSIRLS